MAENKTSLFPVFDVPATLAEDIENEERYAPAPLWDVERGDFVTDGANRTLYGSGYDAWVLWCTKSILTQRWAHTSYSGDTGIEAEQAFRESDRKAAESAFERTITEALLHQTTKSRSKSLRLRLVYSENTLLNSTKQPLSTLTFATSSRP